LTSTAIVMQMLQERGTLSTLKGQRIIAILLFEDLAIVPLLAIVAILGTATPVVTSQPRWIEVLAALVAIVGIVAFARYLLNPIFRILADSKAREVMTAAALLVVLGAAFIMDLVGLSMAMGAFIAGVLLAESSYRHELEADIEPFRGILLGLFFMAVGLSLDLSVIVENWLVIVVAVPLLMAAKAALIYGLTRLFGSEHDNAVRTAFLLPQGGEFGFVLFSAAASASIFPAATSAA
jgi:Kef-type K+ transport system membrane component KefB